MPHTLPAYLDAVEQGRIPADEMVHRTRLARTAFKEALAEAHNVGRRAGIEESARLVEPSGPRPCDCDDCHCGSWTNAHEARAWDVDTSVAKRVRALADGDAAITAGRPINRHASLSVTLGLVREAVEAVCPPGALPQSHEVDGFPEDVAEAMALVSAIHALRPSPEVAEAVRAEREAWEPIETAPHGEAVLLFCPDRGATNEQRIELGYASSGSRNHVSSSISRHAWATHWRPLPLPPSSRPSPDVAVSPTCAEIAQVAPPPDLAAMRRVVEAARAVIVAAGRPGLDPLFLALQPLRDALSALPGGEP